MQSVKGTSGEECWHLALGLLGDIRGKSILDAASGGGYFANLMVDRGAMVMACDLVNQWQFPNIPFKIVDFDDGLPYENASFDGISVVEALNYVESPSRLFREAQRTIKEGGSLIVTFPNCLTAESRFKFLFSGSYRWFPHPLFTGRPKSEYFDVGHDPVRVTTILFLLKQAGFVVEAVKFGGISIRLHFLPLAVFIYAVTWLSNLLRKLEKRVPKYASSFDSLVKCNVGIRARKIQ